MVAIILLFFLQVQAATEQSPLLVYRSEFQDFTYQTTVFEVGPQTVRIVTNSNILFLNQKVVRIGSWLVQNPRAESFIKSLHRLVEQKIPITLDRRSHATRTWILGKKVELTEIENSVYIDFIQDFLMQSNATLESGLEFDNANKKVLRAKPLADQVPNCEAREKICKFGTTAWIHY